MKKKLLLIVLTFMLFFSFSELASAAKKQYICRYTTSGVTAEFRLRLASDGKTRAESANISGDEVEAWGKVNQETVLNWSNDEKETGFRGKDYYEQYENCPPYAYFFDTPAAFLGMGGGYQLFVSDEAAGGTFESKLKDEYDVRGTMYVLSLTGPAEVEPEKLPTSCLDFNKDANPSSELLEEKYSCENNPYFACVWNETNANPAGGYCNTDKLQYVKCGDAFDIPAQVPEIISFAVNLLKIAAPIILVIVSVIALLKALAASKEDEIKKAQQSLIRKMIAAAMVFFVISIVQFVILKVADVSEVDDMSSCLTCMLNNDCDNTLYYKTNVGGQYFCTGLSGNEIECGEVEHQND